MYVVFLARRFLFPFFFFFFVSRVWTAMVFSFLHVYLFVV
jgi:hypothetical protein